MDLGGFFIKGLAPDPHQTIATVLQVPVRYALHPELDGICVLPVAPDVYLWTSEHLALARALHDALGRTVVGCAYERHGAYEAYVSDASDQRLSAATPFPFVVGAKALGITMERLRDLLEGPGREPSELAAWMADIAKDEHRLHPGRRALTLFVSDGIAEELATVARTFDTDVGTVVWCGWEAAKPTSYKRWTKNKGPAAKPPAELPLLPTPQSRPALERQGCQRLSVWLPERVIREIESVSERLDAGTGAVFTTAWELGRDRVPFAR